MFHLFFLLTGALEDGIDRAEIYAHIPAYAEHNALDTARMEQRTASMKPALPDCSETVRISKHVV